MNLKEMKRKKLKFTIFSLIIHVVIVGVFVFCERFDPTLWGTWFGSFNITIGIYAKFNVDQKKVIAENYIPELVGK